VTASTSARPAEPAEETGPSDRLPSRAGRYIDLV
jgi:hypothetical protein